MLYAIPFFELKYIHFANYPIPSWVPLFWIGMFGFLIIVIKEAKRLKIDIPTVWIIFLLDYILGEFFARLFFVLSHGLLHRDLYNYYIFNSNDLGRVYFGALLGLLISVWLGVTITKQKNNLYKYFDIALIGHVFALFFYRIGNVLWHSHMGKITTLPWGMQYFGVVRHEVSMYESISMGLLFVVIWKLRRKIKIKGIISLIILAWIAMSHFVTDFFRSDDLLKSNFHFSNGLTLNQLAYLGILILIFLTFLHLVRKTSHKITKS